MKSYKKFLMVIMVLLAMTISLPVVAQANNQVADMMVCFVNEEAFGKFLENPSVDMLKSDDTVECEIYSAQSVEQNQGWGMSIGDLPVYSTLIEFMGSKENISTYLAKNGVTGEVDNMVLVCADLPEAVKVPPTLWVEVNKKDYYITIAIKIDEDTYLNGGEYVYCLYSGEEYKDKFGFKDAVLCINGNNASEENYVKIQNGGAYLPLRAIMEGVGCGVEWSDVDRTVHITCGEQKYILHTQNRLSLYENGSEQDLLIPPPGSFNTFTYTIINDRIIMDDYTMRVFLSLINAQMNIDFDLMTINITR
ncbi:MAG: hypothetical protein IKV89_02235 [Clostridia bacterium]|nr:hypothetical protein [Clostridia bacterium]